MTEHNANNSNTTNRTNDRKTPDFPTHCRMCNGQLDCLPYFGRDAWTDEQGRFCRVIAYDIYTGEPRTFEYTLACRNNPNHTQLKVVETPCVGFRCVIRADRYDEKRVMR